MKFKKYFTKEMEVLEKVNEKPCGCTHRLTQSQRVAPNPNCKSCKGTGYLQDNLMFHLVNGICVDGDTIK